MPGALRTFALRLQKYYEFYMQVWNELRHLEAFFGEKDRHGKSNLELYELVPGFVLSWLAIWVVSLTGPAPRAPGG